MCDISHSLNRHQVVDFSDFLYADEHTFIAQHPSDLKDITWSYLLLPFDLPTWALIAVMLFAFFGAFLYRQKSSQKCEKIGSSFLKAVSLFLSQCRLN